MREKLEAVWVGSHKRLDCEWPVFCRQCDRFIRLLDTEAWLDAAMMLVPEGWFFQIKGFKGNVLFNAWVRPNQIGTEKEVSASGPTPAEALLAAIEKARTM
jgi:hypothetical protein